VSILLLMACAPAQQVQPEPMGVEIEGVVIRNKLTFPITDVQILVPSSGNFVGCGNIMARSACATTFPVREYYGDAVVVTWKEYGTAHTTGEFVIDIADSIDLGRPAQLEVIVFLMGQAGAELVQTVP
jgi:hypothetical protein